MNQFKKTGRLSGRIALVTGASRGIGRAVAIRYAMEGASVIVLATNTNRLESVDDDIKKMTGRSASLVKMDLTNFQEIDRLGHQVFNRFGKLDILVGNAGILGQLTPVNQIKSDIWERVLNVNLSANWHLLRTFDPLLRRSDSGRVIFVTSTVGSIPRSYWGAYSISKSGLEMMTKIYASEQTKTNIKANIINPGATRTDMRAQAMPGENPISVKSPEEITDSFVMLAEKKCKLNSQIVSESGKVLQ